MWVKFTVEINITSVSSGIYIFSVGYLWDVEAAAAVVCAATGLAAVEGGCVSRYRPILPG